MANAGDQLLGSADSALDRMRLKLRSILMPSQPVTEAKAFAGRRQVLSQLISAVEDQRLHVVLYGSRGMGKTSLLHAHLDAMREAGHRTSYVDFDRVGTVADVAGRLVDGLRQLPVDPERRIERRLSRLGVSIGTTGLTVQVAPRRPGRWLVPSRTCSPAARPR